MKWVLLIGSLLGMLSPIEAAQGSSLREPRTCQAGMDLRCAIRVFGEEEFKAEKYEVALSRNSSVVTEGDSSLRFLDGTIFLSAKQSVSLFVAAQEISVKGDVLISESSAGETVLYNLDAELTSKSEILTQELLPLKGLRVELNSPKILAQLKVGFPQESRVEDFLKIIKKVSHYSGLKRRLQVYLGHIQKSSQVASELYGQVVERRLASISEKEARQKREAELQEKERQELRRMFRERNYLLD